MTKSTEDDLKVSIQSYMDSTRTEKTQEEGWMQRKHKKKKGLLIIELEPPCLKSERGMSGDMVVAYRKTELNSYSNDMGKIKGNDTRIGIEIAYRKPNTISYSDTMEEMDENNTFEKTITKKKWVGPKAGHNCKEYVDQQESKGQTGHQEDTDWSKPGNEHKQTMKYGGRAVRKKNKRKRNGKVEPRNETAKSRRREAVRSHSSFSLKRSSLRTVLRN